MNDFSDGIPADLTPDELHDHADAFNRHFAVLFADVEVLGHGIYKIHVLDKNDNRIFTADDLDALDRYTNTLDDLIGAAA